jgi:hypothetical protein
VAGGLTPAAAKLELSPGSKKPATMTQMRAAGLDSENQKYPESSFS